jgi:serine phosphatase RsbU (regulator of sigma subunit)
MEALDRRLYQEERRLSRKEIDFLKETREALLPPVPPIFGKVAYHVVFQQHDKTIGGDYYQIEEVVPEKVIDFWLSDCAGSGIAAAYQMAQARAALNTLWPEKLPPEDMLLRLNDALRRVFHKNNFIAATYLRLDLETQTYTLYRPGNPEILYWDPPHPKSRDPSARRRRPGQCELYPRAAYSGKAFSTAHPRRHLALLQRWLHRSY